MPHDAQLNGARGFTLIEVLAALLVMTIGLFGLLALFPQALSSTKRSGKLSVLSHLAAEKMEQLHALDLSDAELAIGTHPTLATDSAGGRYYPVAGFPEEYSLRWTVAAGPTDGGGSAETRLRTVSLETTFGIRYTSGGTELDAPHGLRVLSRTFVID